MAMTINELGQLREKGFGQPYPRHGLNLLYWFALECIEFDEYNRIVSKVNFNGGAYGFHRFHNRIDDGNTPVPNQNLRKYEVGNLGAPGADKLPWYVRENYERHRNGCNMDRIIVCVNDAGHFERVYIAQHTSQMDFSRSCTYRISQGLLKTIQCMGRKEFLETMVPVVPSGTRPTRNERPPENNSWCLIL